MLEVIFDLHLNQGDRSGINDER